MRTFFGSICENLNPYLPGIKKGTSNKWSHVDKYKNAHVKAELLKDITSEAINRFLTDRIEYDNWKPKTANLMRQILHKLFAYAIKHHGFRSRDRKYPNPVDAVERYRESAPVRRYLSIEQIKVQLEILKESSVIYFMVATYIFAGLRREEAIWLTYDDVDLAPIFAER